MKSLHLGLFGRFFFLFAVTTISLVVFILLGIVGMSDYDAKTYLVENQTYFQETLERIAREPLDIKKLEQDATDNRVELLVIKAGKRWSTSPTFPDIEQLTQSAERIGGLFFTKFEGKYYLSVQHDSHYASVTSNIMNLIIYPHWIVFWPWVGVVVIILASYGVLRRLLNPIRAAIHSAERLSRGELDYQIEKHPKTELAALTKSQNLMARNLSQLFNAQDDLLLAISHELRSPLARMKVSLAMLDNNDIVAGLGQDIGHMDDLIAQLLEGERLKRGASRLEITAFYLPTLIEDLLAEADIKERVVLSSEVPDLAIDIDVGRIKFALRNLLKNGIAHTAKGTNVSLTIEQQESKVDITVRDSGPGIPQQLVERIFEPFFRVENIDNRSFNGVGLGLYLCKRIVEAHEGELKVSNFAEGGCRFTMTLPLS